jgi:hypothetical protein
MWVKTMKELKSRKDKDGNNNAIAEVLGSGLL